MSRTSTGTRYRPSSPAASRSPRKSRKLFFMHLARSCLARRQVLQRAALHRCPFGTAQLNLADELVGEKPIGWRKACSAHIGLDRPARRLDQNRIHVTEPVLRDRRHQSKRGADRLAEFEGLAVRRAAALEFLQALDM